MFYRGCMLFRYRPRSLIFLRKTIGLSPGYLLLAPMQRILGGKWVESGWFGVDSRRKVGVFWWILGEKYVDLMVLRRK